MDSDFNTDDDQNQRDSHSDAPTVLSDGLMYPFYLESKIKFNIHKIYVKLSDYEDEMKFTMSVTEKFLMKDTNDTKDIPLSIAGDILRLVKALLPKQKETCHAYKHVSRRMMFEHALRSREKQNEKDKINGVQDELNRAEEDYGYLLIDFKIGIIDDKDVIIECERYN